jgi:RNA polymerase sigma-70 factor (ECF subfamily)
MPKVEPPVEGSFGIEIAFQALINHLSPLQRAVFLLRDVMDYSIAETARLLVTSEGAVKAAHHRARHSLKAVKEDLEHGMLPMPQQEEEKAFLRALAHAYQIGDVNTLIVLVFRDEVEPEAVVGRLHNERHHSRSVRSSADFQANSYCYTTMMSA